MAEFRNKEVSIAFDMCGCPNRCRHCWLGLPPDRKQMPEKEVFEIFEEIKSTVEGGVFEPYLSRIRNFDSWFYEPDFSKDYANLYEKELKYNNGENYRKKFELISTWRFAQDESYAKWIKEIGIKKAQVTLFGLEETTDWFYRRKGAFKGNILATQRMLDLGIQPRWQLFLTKKILPELGGIMELIKELRLRERVKELGGDFDIYIHDPGPEGEARKLQYLRPNLEDIAVIPEELIISSEKYLKGKLEWHTEAELVKEILAGEDILPVRKPNPGICCLFVMSNWDVYSNYFTMEKWWKLGNLKKEPLQKFIGNFIGDTPFGYNALKKVKAKQLVREFGDIKSRKIYGDKNSLLVYYFEEYCEANYLKV